MSTVAKFENLKDLIVQLRGQSVLLDSDVAAIYKVETKRVNEAVKNNPDKFPHDYMFEITEKEFSDLRSKFSTTKFTKTRALPKAFTEKGLYMIATILKSKQATEGALSGTGIDILIKVIILLGLLFSIYPLEIFKHRWQAEGGGRKTEV